MKTLQDHYRRSPCSVRSVDSGERYPGREAGRHPDLGDFAFDDQEICGLHIVGNVRGVTPYCLPGVALLQEIVVVAEIAGEALGALVQLPA